MDSKDKFKKTVEIMKKSTTAKVWAEMDNFDDNAFDELNSQNSNLSKDNPKKPQKVRRKDKKVSQIEQYEQALAILRRENTRFLRPFDRHPLNIQIMSAIKMLQDAIETDKNFVQTLRQMGCKTRMRVRNKQAAFQLFQVMLNYLQESTLPAWMRQGHLNLLKKSDKQFDEEFLKMEEERY